ncbi:GNAT family N-acetyltransferase [Litchfieldella xinjiangensis]|uniref:GNAT family N-acetyltransferase n=1 Tax=Litchfieldella xinjiangensis TaxID=1166948 RepID=UPI0005B77F80|nr:GNAT family N-acetyltransferase [Halomonas xinjiangensis]
MLTTLKRLWRPRSIPVAVPPTAVGKEVAPLAAGTAGDIEAFLGAARRADDQGHSPWVLRDESRIETLRHVLTHTVSRGVWLQRENERVAHWQGQLLTLRHGDGAPLGMALVCRPSEEVAWQLRFFFIEPQWQGSGHGARLLAETRRTLRGMPVHARLPMACHAAVSSLVQAGFQRMYIDATGIATFQAPAEWHD